MELLKNIFMVSSFVLKSTCISLDGMANFCVTFIGPLTRGQSINWIKRLEIAEDAAKGL